MGVGGWGGWWGEGGGGGGGPWRQSVKEQMQSWEQNPEVCDTVRKDEIYDPVVGSLWGQVFQSGFHQRSPTTVSFVSSLHATSMA